MYSCEKIVFIKMSQRSAYVCGKEGGGRVASQSDPKYTTKVKRT